LLELINNQTKYSEKMVNYLDDDIVKELLAGKWHTLIENIESAIVDPTADMIPKTYLDCKQGDFRAMPAALQCYASLKWIGVFPNNWQIPTPTTQGTLILSDRETGTTLMAMDCITLTAYRTAAVSAIAAKHCCPDATNFAFIGCGLQARYHIEAYEAIYGHTNMHIDVYDKDEKAMKDLYSWIGKENIASGWGWNKSVKQACAHADVVTTLTPSTEAYLGLEDLGETVMHINAIGADAVGKRELKDNIWRAFDLVVDDREQAAHSGETQYVDGSPHHTLKEIIQGCDATDNPTVFDSTGLAIEDIATAILIYKAQQDKD
jgi:ornithine cyclodeaminase/alanine dehydrogenase-like protein (mu-crystallin family)